MLNVLYLLNRSLRLYIVAAVTNVAKGPNSEGLGSRSSDDIKWTQICCFRDLDTMESF